MTLTTAEPFAHWVILEVMGHRRLAGYVTETQIAGAGFLRLDIPAEPPVTQYYRPESVYALTPTTEEIARAAARHARPEPVHPWELEPPRPAPEPEGVRYDEEGPF